MSQIVFDIPNDVLLALKVSAEDAWTARDQTSEVGSQKGRGAMKPWRGIPPKLNT